MDTGAHSYTHRYTSTHAYTMSLETTDVETATELCKATTERHRYACDLIMACHCACIYVIKHTLIRPRRSPQLCSHFPSPPGTVTLVERALCDFKGSPTHKTENKVDPSVFYHSNIRFRYDMSNKYADMDTLLPIMPNR